MLEYTEAVFLNAEIHSSALLYNPRVGDSKLLCNLDFFLPSISAASNSQGERIFEKKKKK